MAVLTGNATTPVGTFTCGLMYGWRDRIYPLVTVGGKLSTQLHRNRVKVCKIFSFISKFNFFKTCFVAAQRPWKPSAKEKSDMHDTPFVFSEVNADICHFTEDEASSWGFSRLRLNQYHVGKLIVTKKVGVDLDDGSHDDMEDVTHLYKNPEGSHAERLSVYNAVRAVRKAQLHYAYPDTPANDVVFDLEEIETLPFGATVTVKVAAENQSDETRTVTAVLSATSVFYTGAAAHRLKKAQGSFTLAPGARETLEIQVPPQDYIYKLVDHNLIKIYAIASVEETKQTWSEEDDFPFEKPNLDIYLDGELCVGKQCSATFSFQNPLDVPLTNCSVSVEGPGLQRPKVVPHRDILPGETISFTELFYPRVSGERKILAVFNTKPLAGMTGSATVVIAP